MCHGGPGLERASLFGERGAGLASLRSAVVLLLDGMFDFARSTGKTRSIWIGLPFPVRQPRECSLVSSAGIFDGSIPPSSPEEHPNLPLGQPNPSVWRRPLADHALDQTFQPCYRRFECYDVRIGEFRWKRMLGFCHVIFKEARWRAGPGGLAESHQGLAMDEWPGKIRGARRLFVSKRLMVGFDG